MDGAWLFSKESFRISSFTFDQSGFLNELNQIEDKTRVEVLNYSAAIWLIMRLTLCFVCVYNLFHLHVRKTVTNA